jgi:hypothetical protein
MIITCNCVSRIGAQIPSRRSPTAFGWHDRIGCNSVAVYRFYEPQGDATVDKHVAGKIVGLLEGAKGCLSGVVECLRDAVPPEELEARMSKIAQAMAELIHFSWEIYDEHPELNPDLEEERTSAQRYAEHLRQKEKDQPPQPDP